MIKNVVDYSVMTVSSSAAVDFLADASPTAPRQATGFFVTCEDNPVHWRADGTPPTATAGHLLAAAGELSFYDANYRQMIDQVEFISTGVAILRISFFD